jgi:hypothetical protein
MLSVRLVQMIEDHAEQLTQGVIHDLQSNQRTPHYHRLTREELHERTYNVYRNLGHWLSYKTDEAIEASYTELARMRLAEGVPLSEIVYALTLLKQHLREYIGYVGLMDSAVELHQERELRRLVGRFFDRAIYYTVLGYERQMALHHAKGPAKRAA